MTFNPQIPTLWLIIILVIALLVTIKSIWSASKLKGSKYKLPILILRVCTLLLLSIILLNPIKTQKIKREKKANKNILLLDASMSMSLEAPDSRLSQLKLVLNDIKKHKKGLINYSFDSIATRIQDFESISKIKAKGNYSNLAASIENVINAEEAKLVKNVIVCSDGRMNDKNKLEQVIALARANEIPISVLGIGKPTSLFNVSIKDCQVKRNASPNTKIPIKVLIESKNANNQTYEIVLKNSKGKIINRKYGDLKDGVISHALSFKTGLTSEKYQLQVTPIDGELTAVDNIVEFKVEVSNPKIRVLYLEGTNINYFCEGGSKPAYRLIYDACKKTGRIDIDAYVVDVQKKVGGEIYNVKTGKKGYPKTKEALSKYDVIICSDINRFVFNESQLEWTRELVSKNGMGFCMIGGDTSFGSGGYDKTVWEQMIPVDMKTFNQAVKWGDIYVSIPEKNLSHPIWKLDNNAQKNSSIIKNHPKFLGTNVVNRAKPGATVLAYCSNYNNMPLICVQSYGKGRSMAFTSDAAGGWGVGYQDRWGKPGTNSYYEKFWANTVLWLAENSLANKNEKITYYTDKLSYFPTDTIRLHAEAEKNLTIKSHFMSNPKVKTKLKYNSKKHLFSSEFQIPKTLKKDKLTLVCNAINKRGEEIASDTLSIPIKKINSEYINTNPDFKSLEALMVLTGGRNIQSAADINSLIDNETRTNSKFEDEQSIPLWDTWWLWVLIVVFLGSEWYIRKQYV